MKRLLLHKLNLISYREKAAIEIPFHQKMTVIHGVNDTGKSSLIKSIYWAFGAESAVVHPKWKEASVCALLEFSIDSIGYKIFRYGPKFAIFDDEGRILLSTTSVTSELGPILGDLLNFRLTLADKDGVSRRATPAFCFLPYYIDQDRGWQESWKSFAKLGQFPRSKTDVALYHSGIRPNEYYDLKAEITDDRLRLADLMSERKAVENAYTRIRDKRKAVTGPIAAASYGAAIDELLREVNLLQEKRSAANNKLARLTSDRLLLEEQIAVAKSALEEIDKDYKFIRTQSDDHLICPTCGVEHHNSFENRFSIIQDGEACRAFLLTSNSMLEVISKKISYETKELRASNFKMSKIERILEQKKGKMKLRDFIDSEGQHKAVELLRSEVESIGKKIKKLDGIIAELERDLGKLTDKERRKKIEQYYLERMVENLRKLSVNNLPISHVERIDCSILDTGSDQPRAVLAYFFAYLRTVEKFGSSCFCPVVVDSPNQQDQDHINLSEIFDLIFSDNLASAQVVLGTVVLPQTEIDGLVIELKNKYHLLQTSEFEKVSSTLQGYLDRFTE